MESGNRNRSSSTGRSLSVEKVSHLIFQFLTNFRLQNVIISKVRKDQPQKTKIRSINSYGKEFLKILMRESIGFTFGKFLCSTIEKITRIPEEKSRLGKVISCFDEQLKKRRLSDEIELRAFQSPFEETEAYVIDLIIVAKKTGTNLVFIDDPDRSKSKIFWGAGEELNEQVGSRQLMLKEHLFKHFFPKTPLLRIRLDPENPEFANQINEILEKHVYPFRKKF